jgi:hypothetical protein
MDAIGSLNFVDRDSGDRAMVLVRADADNVALAVSLERDGDVEVFMPRDDARRLIDVLQAALAGT